MRVKREITLGNILSIIGTVMVVGTAAVTIINYASSAVAEFRAADMRHDERIAKIEVDRDFRKKLLDERFDKITSDKEAMKVGIAQLAEQNRFMIDQLRQISQKLDRTP